MCYVGFEPTTPAPHTGMLPLTPITPCYLQISCRTFRAAQQNRTAVLTLAMLYNSHYTSAANKPEQVGVIETPSSDWKSEALTVMLYLQIVILPELESGTGSS